MTALLLDTHALYWWLIGSPRLSERARDSVSDLQNDVAASVVSLYELGLKIRRERVDVSLQALRAGTARSGIDWLPVGPDHAGLASELPDGHKDPWDRLLAAQAILEGRLLVSKDAKLDYFGIERLW